jgi:hypothetical protein
LTSKHKIQHHLSRDEIWTNTKRNYKWELNRNMDLHMAYCVLAIV